MRKSLTDQQAIDLSVIQALSGAALVAIKVTLITAHGAEWPEYLRSTKEKLCARLSRLPKQ